MLPYVHRITKYDPADRDERGVYVGALDSTSDHGPVEAAYLAAVAAFAEESGARRLAVREPQVAPGSVHFGLEPAVAGGGLAGLFPADLTGYHDGASVTLPVALELVRAMLRDNGAWCRLEAEDAFEVHVGWDQYVHVASAVPCAAAVARARALGLFPEPVDATGHELEPDEEAGRQRPADEEFWERVRWCVTEHRTLLLEESHVANASRWHRLADRAGIAAVRARLAPRARLALWPDLSADVAAVLAGLPEEGLLEFVWEDLDGRITSAVADEDGFAELADRIRDARAAAVLPVYVDERRPLFTGVLPDADGVLRARWRTDPCPGDRDWAFLKTLRRGQLVTGTVSRVADFGVTFVDIGGFTAMINIPELSWRPFRDPGEVVTVGQRITARILDVDLVRERVPLSLKAARPDPLRELAERVGQVVTGEVTGRVPAGLLVRIEDRPDGFTGLLPGTDGGVGVGVGGGVGVGDRLAVELVEVDPEARRITLAPARPSTG
ncbi:S1 RNA-binding domain-containing protein [Kitasatospora viridis]|uniref:Small subunit ribosomal protein S1 n=1 Tax=Kitasatospora viridis TaxID=281105 RepID=A0A561S9L4_9ACTN|nr:S1 RNA-binding domain-containing protein [Kitasatospora viridis]TWF71561.1 small subunit ribosomal protein S1 [Kitasatospora viridis]